MANIQINYLADNGALLGSHVTDDAFTPDEVAQWEEWLNDSAVDHPGAPDGWTQFELVEFCALCPDGHHGQGYSCAR